MSVVPGVMEVMTTQVQLYCSIFEHVLKIPWEIHWDASPEYFSIFLLDDLSYPQLHFDVFELNKSLYIQSVLYEPSLQYCYNYNTCKIKLVHN